MDTTATYASASDYLPRAIVYPRSDVGDTTALGNPSLFVNGGRFANVNHLRKQGICGAKIQKLVVPKKKSGPSQRLRHLVITPEFVNTKPVTHQSAIC